MPRSISKEHASQLDTLGAVVEFDHYGQPSGTTRVVARLRDKHSNAVFHFAEGGSKDLALAAALASAPRGVRADKTKQQIAAELEASKQREAELQAEIERLRGKTAQVKGETPDRRAALVAALESAGVEFDKRLGIQKLESLAAEHNVSVAS